MIDSPNYKVNGIKHLGQEDITWQRLVIPLMKQLKIYKRASREIEKRRFKKYRFVAYQRMSLRYRNFWGIVTIAIWRAGNKPPLEVAVANLVTNVTWKVFQCILNILWWLHVILFKKQTGNVSFSLCHLYFVYWFCFSCHKIRSPMI